jgi:hypothetical protein
MDTQEPTQRQVRFTLRELFVLVAIFAVAAAVLTPSIRRARENALQAQCANNLKTIGLGIHNFHDLRQEICPSYLTDDHSPAALPKGYITWPILLLPYLESNSTFQKVEVTAPLDQTVPAPADHAFIAGMSLSIYTCPARRTTPAQTLGPMPLAAGDYGNVSFADAYKRSPINPGAPRTWDAAMLPSRAFNAATTPNTVPLNDFPAGTLGGREYRSMTSFASIFDGLSHTAFLGEKAVRQDRLGIDNVLTGFQDGALYYGYGGNPANLAAPGDMASWSRRLAPTQPGERLLALPRQEDPNNRFGGWHTGVTLFLMGDGSVNAINAYAGTAILQRLGGRYDRESYCLP